MFKLSNIRYNLSQILALTEKNIKLQLRFKFNLIFSYITPIISILMPLIIMGNLFAYNPQFGPWTSTNFVVYQFVAYNILLIQGIITIFPQQFRIEKYWKTLPALIIGPFTRFNMLLGIFLSHLIMISIPFTLFFIITYIFYPINIFTLVFILMIYFLITLILSGIGLILGIFAVSNENIWRVLGFLINFIFWFSCITYPFELFPNFLQNVINLNPLYYIFDFLRLSWIENDIVTTLTNHQIHLFVLIGNAIIFPFIGVYIFNITYKKYGITGY
jgi:ABC-type polysaccharide/polyol phosphate export permease